MPLFGNRMVVATANYKHIRDKKKEVFERESKLGRWVKERKERKQKLQELNQRIRENSFTSLETARSRQGSIVSEGATAHPESQEQEQQQHEHEDTDHIVVEPSANSSGKSVKGACCMCVVQ